MERRASIDYYLEPGHVYFSRHAANIRTVLGSCVTVCLWDRRLKCGGMTHFMYPSVHVRDQATSKYGNVAVLALFKMMKKAGCRNGDIEAQIFGGAHPEGTNGNNGNNVGGENVRVARAVLERNSVPVLSQDVGGVMGRKIVFDTGTGDVAVLKVHKIRDADWLTGPGEESSRGN